LSQTFTVPTFNVDSLNLPDTLSFEVTTWMRDGQGNCAAAVGADSVVALTCGASGGYTVAQGRSGQRLIRSIVAGKTVLLPVGGQIMDAAVDTTRRKLFLSNIETNRLEVFDLSTESFGTAIGVGSEPWGLAVTRDGQSMWVANSGGTNLSKVDLATRREIDNARFLTPDVVLFDVELRTGDAGVQYLITPIPQNKSPSFSDRPQYVAVDSFGNLVYSTKTTAVGDLGTARKGFFEPGWERTEAKIFVEHGNFAPQENFWAIAHIDSITSTVDTLSVDSAGVATVAAVLGLFDHVPGFPSDIVKGVARSDFFDAITEAAAELVSQGSDIYIVPGSRWDVESILFRDTTYVAASGDGGWVAIGEGGADPVGRVLTYQARPGEETSLSRWIQVSDLLTNPSEEVRGIGLNYDGTLGVVRGQFAAYFISPPDLRLQGVTEIPLASGGSGATLHPLHADARTLDNFAGEYRPDTHLAFVASGQRTVDIIDTQRFTRVGRVYIRDNITGPLRAVLPFPADNAAFTCATIPVTDKRGAVVGNAVKLYDAGDFDAPIGPNGETEDRCVVVKLFGTTEAGGVVVIDVRKADVLSEHPARE
jgi:DNA-binding beta-propeller fold protein YncE